MINKSAGFVCALFIVLPWSSIPLQIIGEQFSVAKPALICSSNHLEASASVVGIQFGSYRNEKSGEACLQVSQSGKVLFQRTNNNDGFFTLGQPQSEDGTVAAIANGTDITGHGHPNMIVSEWTGGAHCCREDYVFELKPKFKLLATLDAQDSDEAHFADLDGNGHYYYLMDDWTFAYWYGSFAGSPVHQVVLRFSNDSTGGGYHLALQKMYKPAPSPADWAKALTAVKNELQLNQKDMANNLPQVLCQEVLDLIYTGHSDLAWKFLQQVGPEAQGGDYPGLADFCSTLKTSPYWPDLKSTMRSMPSECTHAQRAK